MTSEAYPAYPANPSGPSRNYRLLQTVDFGVTLK